MNGSTETATRGVAVIVLAGAFLGAGYNYLGQNSKPVTGLAWIAAPKQLDSLEALLQSGAAPSKPSASTTPGSQPSPTTSVAGGDTVAPGPHAAGQGALAAEPTTKSPSGSPSTAAASDPPPPAPSKSSAATTTTTTTTTRTTVADPDDPLGIEVPAPNDAGLPEIPDLDRPFAVELATVKRFFDARAAYIVDARDPEEFEEGHIPGAVNLPFSTAGTDPARLEAIDPGDRPIIIYCGGGTCEVSMTLAEALVYQYAKRKVLVYMGGFPEWASAGYPVRRGKEGEVEG